MLGQKRNREEERFDEKISLIKNSTNGKRNVNTNFLMKLYQILETSELNSIIEWEENGKSFSVKNLKEFTEIVLPKFFKHNNFASFVRQVNKNFYKLFVTN